MGLFDWIFKRPERLEAERVFRTFTAYRPAFTSWGGKLYESDLIRAACDAKARHISKLQVKFVGPAKPRLMNAAKYKPNSFMVWSQFLYRISVILDMDNTAFIVPFEDWDGTMIGYYPVLPARCEVVESDGEIYLRYAFSGGQIAAVEFERCGILTRHQYRDDFFGETNRALDPTLQLIHLQNQGIREAIKNGATFRFMGQLTNFRSPKDLTRERENFTAENMQTDAGGFLLLPSTYTNVKQIDSKPYSVDSEQAKQIQTNVYNYLGVNEKIMQSSAIGDELDGFYEGEIEPFIVQLHEVITDMTYSTREQAQGSSVEIIANRLQYMKTSEKISFVKEMSDRGLITINEARELLNYPPIGPEGDKRPARGEYYFVDDEGNSSRGEE